MIEIVGNSTSGTVEKSLGELLATVRDHFAVRTSYWSTSTAAASTPGRYRWPGRTARRGPGPRAGGGYRRCLPLSGTMAPITVASRCSLVRDRLRAECRRLLGNGPPFRGADGLAADYRGGRPSVIPVSQQPSLCIRWLRPAVCRRGLVPGGLRGSANSCGAHRDVAGAARADDPLHDWFPALGCGARADHRRAAAHRGVGASTWPAALPLQWLVGDVRGVADLGLRRQDNPGRR